MKVTQEDIVSNQTVLQVELEPEDVDKYLNWAYRRVVQRVNIPGFRKGKAPRSIVERFVGREALLSDALDRLTSETAFNAIEQQKLVTAAIPDVDVEKLDASDPSVVLKITVPLVPGIDLGDYKALRVPYQEPEITDEQVEEGLRQLQRDLAPWEPVDRAVQLEDMLTMDVEGAVDGETVLADKDVVYVADPHNPRPFPGFPQKLVGLTKGLQQDFTLSIPEDHGNPELAGKECKFVATVKEIKERRLAELDDEFAKGVGEGYDDLETLQQKIRSNLKEHAESHTLQGYRETVVDSLVAQAEFELPPLLVEREIDEMQKENEDALERRQLSMEQYLSSVGKTEEQLRDEYREEAVRGLRRSWVLTKLGELEDIKVEEDELDSKVQQMTADSGPNSQRMRRVFETVRGRDSLRRSLMTDKILDRVVAIANGTAQEQEDEGKQEPQAEEREVETP